MDYTFKQDFGIAGSSELDSLLFQFRSQLSIVVNLAIINETVPLVPVPKRLIASRIKVKKREPSMNQSDPFVRKYTLVVRPSMLN